MKIAISTGTYPPEIGGSSDYASHLESTLRVQNHEVAIVTYSKIKHFSTGFRHLLYFFKLIHDAHDTDYIIALDAFSVGLPSVIFAKLFRKKIVVRLGGDFLWEAYVDRTKKPVFLSEFYTSQRQYSVKEKITFVLIRFVLRNADKVVFSTKWQRNIMLGPYGLALGRTSVIENCYGLPSEKSKTDFSQKVFLSPSRDRYLKNKKNLHIAFQKVALEYPDILLDTGTTSHELMLEKIKKSYAVVVVSISEVSPNLVLHALEYGVPVVMTMDTGIADRLKDLVIFVNPLQTEDVARGIESLLDAKIYAEYKKKILHMNYSHSWNEIAQEFLNIYQTL